MTIRTLHHYVISALLVLCCFAGCVTGNEEQVPRDPEKHPRIQIFASRKHDVTIVKVAEKEKESFVRIDGKIVARWVQLGTTDFDKDENAVVRESQDEKKWILTLVSKNDLSVEHFEHLYVLQGEGEPAVGVQLSDQGKRQVHALVPADKVGRHLAIIIKGKLRGQGKIVTPMSDLYILAGKYSIEEVEEIAKAFAKR